MAVADELRDEEVLACVVLKRPLPREEAARALFKHCNERLAYYKPPGWLHIVRKPADDRHAEDPEAQHLSRRQRSRGLPDIVDMRALKRASASVTGAG